MLLYFLSASALLALMPGPNNIFVLTESVAKGKRDGIAISAGLVSGVVVHTTIIATGLSVFIQQSETVFFIIKVLGALYLLYLAYESYQEPIDNDRSGMTQVKKTKLSEKRVSFFSLYKKGVLMNVLNPKVTLFFIAFLPQFVAEDGFSFEIQIFLLGFAFMIQSFFIFVMIAVLADRLSIIFSSEIFWTRMKWVKILVLVGLSLFLLL